MLPLSSLSLHLWHDAEKYCNSSTQVHPRQLNKTSESHGIVCRWREHNNDINIASEHHRAKSTVVAQVSCLRLKFAIHPASLRLETICRDLWIHNSPRSLAACFCCVEEFFPTFFLLLLLPSLILISRFHEKILSSTPARIKLTQGGCEMWVKSSTLFCYMLERESERYELSWMELRDVRKRRWSVKAAKERNQQNLFSPSRHCLTLTCCDEAQAYVLKRRRRFAARIFKPPRRARRKAWNKMKWKWKTRNWKNLPSLFVFTPQGSEREMKSWRVQRGSRMKWEEGGEGGDAVCGMLNAKQIKLIVASKISVLSRPNLHASSRCQLLRRSQVRFWHSWLRNAFPFCYIAAALSSLIKLTDTKKKCMTVSRESHEIVDVTHSRIGKWKCVAKFQTLSLMTTSFRI